MDDCQGCSDQIDDCRGCHCHFLLNFEFPPIKSDDLGTKVGVKKNLRTFDVKVVRRFFLHAFRVIFDR